MNWVEHHAQDIRGRYHVWLEPLDPKDLPTVDDVYSAARDVIPDFDKREFDLHRETLSHGAYHLTEKGFITWPSTS